MNCELKPPEKLINVTKISKLLNLSYTQVEVYSEKLIQNLESRQSPQEKFMVLDKSWLTDWGYIQTVIDSVVTDVNSNGVLKLSDVRLVNGLNMKVVCGLEYWVNMIRGYLEPEIRIDAVEKYTLYTDQYAKKITPVVQKVIEKLETPTTISTIDEFKLIPEGLRSSIIEELVQTQKVAGQLQANVFVPQSTDDDLIDWVKLNFSSNGYIAYDMMKHRGIHTPQEFIKKHLQDAILLPTGATSELIVLQADAAIEEYLSLDKIVNLMTMFPSIFTKPDIIALIPHLPSLHEMTPKPVILGETYVVSEGYLENCIELLKEFIQKKVTADLKTKKSGSFSGTGKNKAIEKLSENGVTIDEIKRELESSLPSLPSQLLIPVARKIRRSVTELYQTQLDSVFVDPNLITTKAQELDVSGDGHHRATDTEFHEQKDKLTGQLWELWVSILLYHEGLKAVTDASLHQSLSKYLLKSHGKSFIQLLTSKLSQPKSPTTSEKLALSQEVQQALRVLEGGLKEKKTDKFVTLGQTILPLLIPEFEWASPISEKAKSDHLNQYINSLLSQLQTANSLALSVHLSVLLLLALHNLEIHASGKFVPGLILILESTLTSSDDSEQIEVLENVKQCMDVVLKNGQGQEKEMSELKENIAKLVRNCTKKSCI
ncbi:hypothetical protein BKA69DRAFT_1067217 [Paraphysoderma sedebokerense]|nr:hypothetical protein BKA69DRAFT_1067217 [Paraphysoderma sedebokerense]